MSILKRLAAEPLIPIILIGLCLYAGYQGLKPDATETIVIRPEVIQVRERFVVDLKGQSLSEDERQQ